MQFHLKNIVWVLNEFKQNDHISCSTDLMNIRSLQMYTRQVTYQLKFSAVHMQVVELCWIKEGTNPEKQWLKTYILFNFARY